MVTNNGTTAMKSWNEMSELDQARANYYEMYKDVYGVRDRSGAMMDWDMARVKEEMARLAIELTRVKAEEAAEEKIAIAKFEKRVRITLSNGAQDRATALRWIFDAEDEYSRADPDYFCYNNGLPDGYFRKVA